MPWNAIFNLVRPKKNNATLIRLMRKDGTALTVTGRTNKWYSIIASQTAGNIHIVVNDVEVDVSKEVCLPGTISEVRIIKGKAKWNMNRIPKSVVKKIKRKWFKPPK